MTSFFFSSRTLSKSVGRLEGDQKIFRNLASFCCFPSFIFSSLFLEYDFREIIIYLLLTPMTYYQKTFVSELDWVPPWALPAPGSEMPLLPPCH
jgi:hypothetical protein